VETGSYDKIERRAYSLEPRVRDATSAKASGRQRPAIPSPSRARRRSIAGTFAGAAEAHAEAIRLLPDFGPDIEVYGFALSGGLALFSTFVALAYIAERKAWRRRETELAAKLEATRAQRDRAEIFLSSEQQLFIAWDGSSGEPDVEGSPQLITDAPTSRRVLAYGSWLTPDAARELEQNVDRLRRRGEAFRLALVGSTGRHFDAEGRAVGGRAVLRLREVSATSSN